MTHPFRTHNCAALTAAEVGQTVRLSGWVHRKRDHGGVLFVDLRDHYGITQIVADEDSPALELLDSLRVESVVTIDGEVADRGNDQSEPPDRGNRGFRALRHRAVARRRAADAGRRRAGLS